MNTNRSVRVKDIVEKFQMEVINKGTDYDTEILTITDVNRPGLQFIGFFDYFDPRRLQIIGKSEVTFLRGYSAEERRKRFEDLFCYEIPALVISRNLDVFPECLEMAQKHGRTLLRTKYTSVEFTAMTIDYLNHALAPVITRHGVLVDVYGEGVLILGDSGIGKSETAIELIKRGHRLVADDAVEITRIGSTLSGTAPELIRNYLEVRGVGVIDVEKLFGVGAVQDSTQIDLVIQFEKWEDDKFYDRLGLDENDTTILDVPVPQITIPVSAGRNLAAIVELAAMNNRQKKHGFNSAREFAAQIDGHIDRVTRENELKNQNPLTEEHLCLGKPHSTARSMTICPTSNGPQMSRWQSIRRSASGDRPNAWPFRKRASSSLC